MSISNLELTYIELQTSQELIFLPIKEFLFAYRGIDKDEFKKVMGLMRTFNRQGACHRDGLRIGLKVSGSVEDGGLLEYFFGSDGSKRLEREKFVQFLRDLHGEVCIFQFRYFNLCFTS